MRLDNHSVASSSPSFNTRADYSDLADVPAHSQARSKQIRSDWSATSDAEKGIWGDRSAISVYVPKAHPPSWTTSSKGSRAAISTEKISIRRPPIAFEGSPLPRAMRKAGSSESLQPSQMQLSNEWKIPYESIDHTDMNTMASIQQEDEAGKLADSQSGLSCHGSCCRRSRSGMQAQCRTATPGPSVNEFQAKSGCTGCWGGCDECCSWWDLLSQGPQMAFGENESKGAGRGFGAGDSFEGRYEPNLERGDGWSGANTYETLRSQNHSEDETLARATARPFTHAHKGNNTPAGRSADDYPKMKHTNPNQNERKRQNQIAKESKAMLNARLDNLSISLKKQLKTGLEGVEQNIAKKLQRLQENSSRYDGHDPELNKIASVFAGNRDGQGFSRADLDLRDLSKQVLKMNMYEKFKREQALLDRLAKIEQTLVTTKPTSDPPCGPTSSARDIEELFHYLAQQKSEIEALKETQLVPEVHGELVKLSNEAQWTRDRINNLENTACEQSRAAKAGLRSHPVGNKEFNRSSAPFETYVPDQPGWEAPEQYAGVAPFESPKPQRSSVTKASGVWGRQAQSSWAGNPQPEWSDGGWVESGQTYQGEGFSGGRDGFGGAIPMAHVYRTPSSQRGSVWGGDREVLHNENIYPVSGARDKAQFYEPSFWSPADASHVLGKHKRPKSPQSCAQSTCKVDSDHLWTIHNGRNGLTPRDSGESGSDVGWGSLQSSRARSPTVQTIEDEDFASTGSATHTVGSSWGRVSSQPHSARNPAHQIFQAQPNQSWYQDTWANGPNQAFEWSKSVSHATDRSEDFARGWNTAPASSWSKDAGNGAGWQRSATVKTRSSRGSQDGWGRSATPIGWGSGTGNAWGAGADGGAGWD